MYVVILIVEGFVSVDGCFVVKVLMFVDDVVDIIIVGVDYYVGCVVYKFIVGFDGFGVVVEGRFVLDMGVLMGGFM